MFADSEEMGLSVWSSLYPSLRDVWTPHLLLSFSLSLPIPPCLSVTNMHRCTETHFWSIQPASLGFRTQEVGKRGVGLKEEASQRQAEIVKMLDGKNRTGTTARQANRGGIQGREADIERWRDKE